MRVRKAALLVALVALHARSARAQTSSDSAAADVLFEEGRAALAKGDTARACEKFDASRRLEPAVGTLLNLADCHDRLGNRRAAWVVFREAVRAMSPSDERQTYAQGRIAALEAKLAKVSLVVTTPLPEGTKVRVGEEPVGAPYDVPRVVDPGPVRVVVQAPGHEDGETRAVATEGSTLRVPLQLGAKLAEGARPRDGRAARGAEASGTSRTLAWVGIGTGVAAVATGAGFGLAALSASSSANDRCSGLLCADAAALAAAQDDARAAETRADVSTALFVAGGAVVVAAGVYLLLTTSPRSASASSLPARLVAAASGRIEL
jgi:hypothetical protein